MKEPSERRQRLRSAWPPALALTAAVSFLVAIYGPLELYFTNMEEFHFDAWALLPELGKLFLVLMAAGLAGLGLCYVLYEKLFDLALCAGITGYLCTYIQGMFLVGNLPALDGQKINWNMYIGQDVQSVVLWGIVGIAVVLAVRFLHRRNMRKLIAGLSCFFSAILLVTGTVVCLQHHGLARKPLTVVTKNHEFQMSTQQNFVIFLLDAVDSKTFDEMLEGEDSQFGEILEDFTYYPNTVGAYPFTMHAIPYILTGQWYENQEDFREFTQQAMAESPLLTSLKAQGYRMGIYEEDLICGTQQAADIENLDFTRWKFVGTWPVHKAELKLVWFKYAPFPLKRLAHINMDDFNRLLILENGARAFHANNQDFYQDVTEETVETGREKCFRFYHIEGAHVPFRYDENVRVIPESQGSYPQNIRCSMTILAQYLRQLKEAGVYDNTAIVVMADHGYGYQREIPVVGRGNPLLAVKGIGERHPLEISQAPISYEDLQEAYQRLLSGAESKDVFDAQEGQQRRRRFLYYQYLDEAHMEEYEQTGHAFDITTMKPTGKKYDAKGAPARRPQTPSQSPGATAEPTQSPGPGHGPRESPRQGSEPGPQETPIG